MLPTASDILGGASLFCWLFAQAPQVYENYKRSSTDGLSSPFLVIWFSGDFTNLVGCILTDQLPFQTYLASYFILIDCILLAQWIHYGRHAKDERGHRRFRGRYRDASIAPMMSPEERYAHANWMSRSLPASSRHSVVIGTTPDLMSSHRSEMPIVPSRAQSLDTSRRSLDRDRGRGIVIDEAVIHAARTPSTARRTGSILLLGVFAFLGFDRADTSAQWVSETTPSAWIVGPEPVRIEWQRLIGRTAAWTCATLYLSSRLPQLWQNYRRKSVEGLSALLFLAAFCGNLLYTSSIVFSPYIQSDPTFLPESIPYLLGSGGTLCFDITILSQIVIYRRRHARKKRSRRQRTLESAPDEGALLASSLSEDEASEDDRRVGRPGRSRTVRRVPTITEESSVFGTTPK